MKIKKTKDTSREKRVTPRSEFSIYFDVSDGQRECPFFQFKKIKNIYLYENMKGGNVIEYVIPYLVFTFVVHILT